MSVSPVPDPAPHEEPGTPPTPPVEVPGPEAAGTEPRRYPSTIGGLFYLVVLGGVVAGVAVSWFGDWREGVRWIGLALLLAAAVRLVLPRRDAGMLAVRHRVVDVTLLAGVGIALILLAGSIPNQPVLP